MADVVYGVKHGSSNTAGQGTLTQRLAYEYDGFGRLTTRTLSAISKSTGYTYVTNGTNGRTTVVDSMTNGSETLSYVYDDNGNITEYRKGGSLQEKYYYDALNQLIRVDSVVQNKTIVYAYDGNGNILSKSEYAYTTGTPSGTPAVTAYTYGSSGWKDKLTAYDGQSITYDGIGNPLTYRDGMTFSWQHGRELASVTLGGATAAYTYDETGSRVQKVSGGVTTTYHVVDGTLMEEVRSDGKTLTYLLDENGTKYGVIYNGAYYYYIFNLQGDVIGLYNSSGTIVARYVYDVWGRLLAVTDNNGNAITDMSNIANLNPIRYRGYYYDVETGFYYLQSRYYDPAVGRFINADGLVSTGQGLLGYNMYAYCGNNPVNCVDPNGCNFFTGIWNGFRDFFVDQYNTVKYVINHPVKAYKDYMSDPWNWFLPAKLIRDQITTTVNLWDMAFSGDIYGLSYFVGGRIGIGTEMLSTIGIGKLISMLKPLSSRSTGELIKSINKNPSKWKLISETTKASTKYRGGFSVERMYMNNRGEFLYEHILKTKTGIIKERHFRGYGK